MPCFSWIDFVVIHSYIELPLFNIFSSGILIISYKRSIITRISNEITNGLIIYAILCRNVAIFYREELASLFQVQEKLKASMNSKWNFWSSCFIANDSCSFHRTWYFVFWHNVHMTVCSCHGTYAFQSESTLYICLNV